jgi:hypothetical protein
MQTADQAGRAVFVAGGTSGINLGIAEAFAEAGARLAGCEIDVLVSGAAGNFPSTALGMSTNGFKAVVDSWRIASRLES